MSAHGLLVSGEVALDSGQGGVVVLQGPDNQVASHAQQSSHCAGSVIMVNRQASRLATFGLSRLWPAAYCAAIALGTHFFVVLIQGYPVSIAQYLSVGLVIAFALRVIPATGSLKAFLARLPRGAMVGVGVKMFTFLHLLAAIAGNVRKSFIPLGLHHGSQHTLSFVSPIAPVMLYLPSGRR